MDRSLARRSRSAAVTSFLDFIKTLSYVVGITLGVGSIFAGVWSVSGSLSVIEKGGRRGTQVDTFSNRNSSFHYCILPFPPEKQSRNSNYMRYKV